MRMAVIGGAALLATAVIAGFVYVTTPPPMPETLERPSLEAPADVAARHAADEQRQRETQAAMTQGSDAQQGGEAIAPPVANAAAPAPGAPALDPVPALDPQPALDPAPHDPTP